MKQVALGTLIAVFAACYVYAQDDANKAEAKKFQGVWKFVDFAHQNEEIANKHKNEGSAEFKDDKITLKVGDMSKEAEFKIDASQTPKRLDLVTSEGHSILAIYEFKEGKLRICAAQPNRDRPATFQPDLDAGQLLATLEKAKK